MSKLMVEHILADCDTAWGLAQRLPALFQCQRLLAGRPDRRRPRTRNPPDSPRDDGRDRRNRIPRSLRHRLPDAGRHLHPRLHPRRGSWPMPTPAPSITSRQVVTPSAAISAPESASPVKEIISAVEEITGKTVPVKYGPAPRRRSAVPGRRSEPRQGTPRLGRRPQGHPRHGRSRLALDLRPERRTIPANQKHA